MTYAKAIASSNIRSHRQLIFQRCSSLRSSISSTGSSTRSVCINIKRRGITAIAAAPLNEQWRPPQFQQSHQKYHFRTIYSIDERKRFYSHSPLPSSSSGGGPTGSEYHQSFQQQIRELEDERNDLFGTNEGDHDNQTTVGNSNSNDVISENDNNNTFFEEQLKELEQERNTLFGSASSADTDVNTNVNVNANEGGEVQKTIHEMNQEREALYNFTTEEKIAWGSVTATTTATATATTNTNNSNGTNSEDVQQPSITHHTHSPEFMDAINKAREAKALYEDKMKEESSLKVTEMIQELKNNYDNDKGIQDHGSTTEDENNPIFTHLDKTGEEVSMVDVDDKVVSKRIAVARTSVLFPPEVMDAFGLFGASNDKNMTNVKTSEVIGPKGPIFATARLAGIMGAKRTSDLIPLCHPLPLSKVHVDIRLEGNRAIIECECRVTSKTGVEMEALAGASVAALTIYDMVKAVSHNVKIESTFLVKKSGGKRDVSI